MSVSVFRIPVLSVTEVEVLQAMIATKRAIDLAFTIGTGADRNEMAKAVQVNVKYYDPLLKVYAIWAWTLASTGAQAAPCIISEELFEKMTLLVNGTFFDPSDERAPENLKPGFQVIKDYQPAIIQAFKEAGTTTQEEIDAAEPGPVDKSMLN
jgi:hypothetical protein